MFLVKMGPNTIKVIRHIELSLLFFPSFHPGQACLDACILDSTLQPLISYHINF